MDLRGENRIPLFANDAIRQGHDGFGIRKVDKGVANIALVLKIHAEVQEIKSALVIAFSVSL